jgi:hypothetical protein
MLPAGWRLIRKRRHRGRCIRLLIAGEDLCLESMDDGLWRRRRLAGRPKHGGEQQCPGFRRSNHDEIVPARQPLLAAALRSKQIDTVSL